MSLPSTKDVPTSPWALHCRGAVSRAEKRKLQQTLKVQLIFHWGCRSPKNLHHRRQHSLSCHSWSYARCTHCQSLSMQKQLPPALLFENGNGRSIQNSPPRPLHNTSNRISPQHPNWALSVAKSENPVLLLEASPSSAAKCLEITGVLTCWAPDLGRALL